MSSVRSDAFTTVLKDPMLRRMAICSAGFSIAEYATWVATLVYAYERGGVREVGLVSFGFLIFAMAAAPMLVRVTSHVRADRALAIGYALQTTVILATAIALNRYPTTLLPYVFAAGCTAAHTATRPILGALLPLVVETPTDLGAANVTMTLFENAGRFVGPFLAAGLITRWSPEMVFRVTFAVGLANTVLSLLAHPPERLRTAGKPTRGDAVRQGARLGRPPAWFVPILVVLSLSALLIGAADVLFVMVSAATGPNGNAAGLLNGSFGAGAVAGAAVSAFLVGRSRLSPFLATGIFVSAAPVLAMSWHIERVSAFVLFGISGIGVSVVRVAGLSLIQRLSRADTAAGLLSLLEALQMGAMAIGALLVSESIRAWGLSTTLVLFGTGLVLGCALVAPALFRLDRHAVAADPEILRIFRSNSIFRLLPAPALERLALHAQTLDVPAGFEITGEGDAGDCYFLVLRGSVNISVKRQDVRTVGPGGGFGEIALLRDGLRTATATSMSEARMLVVRRNEFLSGLSEHRGSFETAEAIAASLLETVRGQ